MIESERIAAIICWFRHIQFTEHHLRQISARVIDFFFGGADLAMARTVVRAMYPGCTFSDED